MNTKLIPCKTCGQEIASSAKSCPKCGAKVKKAIYKRVWFWCVLVIAITAAGSAGGTGDQSTATAPLQREAGDTQSGAGSSTAQTPVPATPAGEDPSSGSMTAGQKNALGSAKNYLRFSAFSHDGLVSQLEFEKYSTEDALYAADHCGADWNEQALKSAKNYLDFSAFSYSGLIQQLEYEKFKPEQAAYGVDHCGADWNEQAVKKGKSYLDLMSFSRQGLIDQLTFEGFTQEQAAYAADQNGL